MGSDSKFVGSIPEIYDRCLATRGTSFLGHAAVIHGFTGVSSFFQSEIRCGLGGFQS